MSASSATAVHAAFIASTANGGNSLASGTVLLTEQHGSASALFNVPNGVPGTAVDRCIRLTTTGSLDSEVRHYLQATGDLLPYLQVRVTRGTSPTGGTSTSCAGFTPDPANYIGQGDGVFYDGLVTGVGTDWDSGRPDPTGAGTPGNSYAGAVFAAQAGIASHWRLGDASATAFTDTVNAAGNGTWAGAPPTAPGALGASGLGGRPVTGAADLSRSFRGTPDRGSAPRQLTGADFTIAFWFRSTQGLGASPQWNGAAGLVDADATGTANDFGVGLRADGSVIAGVGNPDTSIDSPAGLNDGEWHHVAFTRTRTGGALALYVDGNLVSTGTGNQNLLTSSNRVWLGAVRDNTNYFVGALDEVTMWNRVLNAAQVRTLLTTGAPAAATETWSQGEAHDYRIRLSVLDAPAAASGGGKSATVTFGWEARNE